MRLIRAKEWIQFPIIQLFADPAVEASLTDEKDDDAISRTSRDSAYTS